MGEEDNSGSEVSDNDNIVNRIKESYLLDFKETILDNSEAVDPHDERDWFDLAYGFFLGKGVDPTGAYALASDLLAKAWL